MSFYITFGQAHPLRDGWIEIEADSRDEAHEWAMETFGGKFAMLYDEDSCSSEYFPNGRYGRKIIV